MSTATSSKTRSFVSALILLSLATAAGFAYWGYQNWDEFNSDYYNRGYQAEQLQAESPIATSSDADRIENVTSTTSTSLDE
jgi:hypothetical protein